MKRLPLFPFELQPCRWAALPMADSSRIEPRLNAILAASPYPFRPKRRHAAAALAAATSALLALAALRVTAKEPHQGRGMTFADTLLQQKRWTRTIPGTDVSVELVGVSLSQPASPIGPERGVSPVAWRLVNSWRPDGVAYPKLLYPSAGFAYGTLFDSEHNRLNGRAVELALRLHNAGSEEPRLSFERHKCEALFTQQKYGKDSGDTLWRLALLNPEQQKRLHLPLRLAAGEYLWHDDQPITSKPQPHWVKIGGQAMRTGCADSYTYSPVNKQRQYQIAVTYSNSSYDTRVAAIDAQGREISGMQETSCGGPEFTQVSLVCDPKQIPPARIAKIRLEARPYQKIAFDDVALYPEK